MCRVNNLATKHSPRRVVDRLREFRERQFTQPSSITLEQPITELRYQKIKSIGGAAVTVSRCKRKGGVDLKLKA